MSRRTSKAQRKVRVPPNRRKKSGSDKTEKPAEIPCGISSCSDYADKHKGGRSLSQENAIDTWGEGAFAVRKNRVRVCKACYKIWKKDSKEDSTPYY